VKSEVVPVHVIKVHGEVAVYPTNSKLGHWTEASGLPHDPVALFRGKMFSCPIEKEAEWTLEAVWILWRRKECVAFVGNRTKSARSSVLYLLSYRGGYLELA
jgi:hypothetical protein